MLCYFLVLSQPGQVKSDQQWDPIHCSQSCSSKMSILYPSCSQPRVIRLKDLLIKGFKSLIIYHLPMWRGSEQMGVLLLAGIMYFMTLLRHPYPFIFLAILSANRARCIYLPDQFYHQGDGPSVFYLYFACGMFIIYYPPDRFAARDSTELTEASDLPPSPPMLCHKIPDHLSTYYADCSQKSIMHPLNLLLRFWTSTIS